MNPLEDLARVLSAALEADERPPCCWPDEGPLWLSEDRAERAEAAERCDGCSISAACADAGEVAGLGGRRASFGVWGGVDRTARPQPKTSRAKRATVTDPTQETR